MAQYDYWPRYGVENYSYTLPMEHTFDPMVSTQWMQANWAHSFTISVIYMILIYLGQKYMESRKAFALDGSLFWWNMSLAIFSCMGMVRLAPEMFWSVNSNSFVYSFCTASFAQGVTGYWTEKFALSKVFELVDTAFIVLRKRPLIFLHWYHHVTVLTYTWHAYKDHTASGRWFMFMNYTVHTFMYTYYALRARRIRVPKAAAMFVTILQIAQMVVGVGLAVAVYYLKSRGDECQQTWTNLYFSFGIYFTYFLLFCNFFYHTYLKNNNRYAKVAKNGGITSNGSTSPVANGGKMMNGELNGKPLKKAVNGLKIVNGGIVENEKFDDSTERLIMTINGDGDAKQCNECGKANGDDDDALMTTNNALLLSGGDIPSHEDTVNLMNGSAPSPTRCRRSAATTTIDNTNRRPSPPVTRSRRRAPRID